MDEAHRYRVAVVASHPVQHECPFYRALAADGRIQLRALFGSDAGHKPYFDSEFHRTIRFQDDLIDGFDSEFLSTDEGAGSPNGEGCERLNQCLEAFDPDVVYVRGYYQRLSRDALAWARQTDRRVLIRFGDGELLHPRSFWKKIIKRAVLPDFSGGLMGFLPSATVTKSTIDITGWNEPLIQVPVCN